MAGPAGPYPGPRTTAAMLAVMAACAGLVLAAAVLGYPISAKWRDGAAALLVITLFFAAALLAAGVRRRCPACRRLFAARLVRETVVGRREEYVAVPRAESALNADRMTGYIERPEMVRVCVEELIVRHRCAHCRYEWETAARQQL